MKSVHELLKQKEAELQQIKREIEALRIVARLLEEDSTGTSVATQAAIMAVTPLAASMRVNKSNGHDTSDVSSRQFP